MFSTAIKPAADNYVLFREDHEHILKFGSSLHGECFCNGVRIEFLAATALPTWPLFLMVRFHGTLVRCQGKLAVGPYGMRHQESFDQLFRSCKLIL